MVREMEVLVAVLMAVLMLKEVILITGLVTLSVSSPGASVVGCCRGVDGREGIGVDFMV